MINFADIIRQETERRCWTPYCLAKESESRGLTKPTVYNLFEGKAVKSDTLAILFDVLGLTVTSNQKGGK